MVGCQELKTKDTAPITTDVQARHGCVYGGCGLEWSQLFHRDRERNWFVNGRGKKGCFHLASRDERTSWGHVNDPHLRGADSDHFATRPASSGQGQGSRRRVCGGDIL